jgi:hypothetical protein
MRKILLLLGLLLGPLFSFPQNTWMQRLGGIDLSPYSNTDTVTGIRDIQMGADGNLLVLAYINQNLNQRIFKISQSGAPIHWQIQVGYHGGITAEYTRGIYPTADSGFIISNNPWNIATSFSTHGTVEKYSKDGLLQWSHQFTPHTDGSPPYYDKAVHHLIQNSSGNFYATIGDGINDTLYEFDNSGNILFETDTIKGSDIYEMPNGNLLVQTFNSTLERRDTSGTIYWSVPSQRTLSFTSTHAFIISPSGVQKLNTAAGTIMWTKTYPFGISSASATADGGFISVSGLIPRGWFDSYSPIINYGNPLPTTLSRVDSLGDTLWTKTFSFPHFGLSCVKSLSSGNIITGGAFIFTNHDHALFDRDYSAFAVSLDSNGNGPLQTTSLIWPGNANNNGICGLVDDILYTGIALGHNGPKRDTLNPSAQDFRKGLMSDYAADWVDTFANGVNYKHADFSGDGLIDTTDLNLYTSSYYTYLQPIIIHQWRLANPFSNSTLLPDFQIIPEEDTVAPGAQIKFFVIAGSSTVPVDSIYGFAFSSFINTQLISDSPNVVFLNTMMGSPGVDLFTMANFGNGYALSLMGTRTNQQNAFYVYDTIATIIMTASDQITTPQLFDFQINDFNAITFGQTELQFNLVGSTVVIDPSFLTVSENESDQINIFPNPANEVLNIQFSPSRGDVYSIEIFNLLGEKLKRYEALKTSLTIPLKDLTKGMYTLRIQSNQAVSNATFVVQH